MNLPDPSNAQAGFVSVIVGAGAGFFGIYVNGRNTTNVTHSTNYGSPPPSSQSGK